jgi:hypothetical protein
MNQLIHRRLEALTTGQVVGLEYLVASILMAEVAGDMYYASQKRVRCITK